jgi:hypothetical protein
MKMLKKVSFLLALVMVVSMFSSLSVSAASEPGYVYDFYYEDDMDYAYTVSGIYCCDVSWEDHALKIVAENLDDLGDPYFYVNNIAEEDMEASDYPYAAFCIKNLTDATEYEGHFGTTMHPVSGSTVFHFDIDPNMTEFKTYVIDMRVQNQINVNRINGPDGISAEEGATGNLVPEMEEGESFWEGSVTNLRFDSAYRGGRSGLAEEGDTLYVAWVAFFETEEDAKNYAGPDHSVERTPEPTADLSNVDSEPYGLLVFDSDADMFYDFFGGQSKNQIEDVYFDSEKKCWSIDVAAGGDPFIEFGFGTLIASEDMDSVSADDYKIIQLGVRVNTAEGAGSGSMYYQTDIHGGYSEAQNVLYNYAKSDNIQCVNIDFNKAGNWKGEVANCRYDLFTSCKENTTVDLYYIAFFADKASADAFAAKFSENGMAALPTAAPTPTKAPTAVPTEVPVTAAPTDAPAVTENAPATDAPKTTGEKTTDDTTKSGNKWLVPVIVVAAVVLAAVVAGVIVLSKKKKKS